MSVLGYWQTEMVLHDEEAPYYRWLEVLASDGGFTRSFLIIPSSTIQPDSA